ncbi:MAG TPA: hypothetical protein VN914_19600, partial [Polyangia bacterium]|nr:hypothetical protein [Polyangia bacterium]
MRRRGSLAAWAALAATLVGAMGAARPAAAAVQIDATLQESVFDRSELESPNLTVGDSPHRLLVVVLATGNLAAQTLEVSWNGAALTKLDGASQTAAGGTCRLELWTLFDPAPGTGPLLIMLSASTGFGVGAVVYSGVDREAPFGTSAWRMGSGAPIALDLAAPGDRPVLGAACLGGPWTTGPTLTTPEVQPGPEEIDLWNFTEPGVVGLGSHRVAMNGRAPVSWEVVGGTDPFQWLAMGISIKPLGEVLPDAGSDALFDALSDAVSDLRGDGAVERGMVPSDAAEPDAAP